MRQRPSIAKPLAVVVTVVAVAAAGVYWYVGRDRVDTPPVAVPSPAGPDVDVEEPVVGIDGPSVTVWVDGWTMRTLDGARLQVAVETAGGDRLALVPVEPVPATEADLEALLGTDPGVVERLMARMVRYDPLLTCTAEGCTSQRGDVELGWLADPATTPVFAPAYTGWEVTAGAWKAEVPAPEGAARLVVGADGWRPVTMSLIRPQTIVDGETGDDPTGDVTGEDAVTGDGDAAGDEPDGAVALPPVASVDGVSVAVAGAFGHLFELSPGWLTDTGTYAGQVFAAPLTVETVGSLEPLADVDDTMFLRGLGHPVAAAGDLGAVTLTGMSSITTGCFTAICVPAVVDVQSETVARFDGTVCVKDGYESRVGDPAHRLGAVTVQQQWSYTLPHPTHQGGFWGGKQVEDLDGHIDGGRGLFTGDPVLTDTIEGPTFLMLLYTGTEPALWAFQSLHNDADVPALNADNWDGWAFAYRRCS